MNDYFYSIGYLLYGKLTVDEIGLSYIDYWDLLDGLADENNQ